MLMGQASQATFFVATRVQNTPPLSEHSCSPGLSCSLSRVRLLLSLLAWRDAIIGENISDGWRNEEQNECVSRSARLHRLSVRYLARFLALPVPCFHDHVQKGLAPRMKEGYTWATCSKVIQSEVKTLQTELSHLCGQNLLGIYLHGSLALGGFQPRRSDIDVIVVTGQRMDLETKRACITMLLRVSKMPCPIDIRFLVQSRLFPFQHPLPCDFQYDETWRETTQQDLRDGSWKDWHERTWRDPDLTIDLTVLHHAGIRLCGKPITEMFPPVSAHPFQEAIIQTMQIARDHPMQNPVSFVLNDCRASAYLQEGLILSKDAGGMWGLTHLPDQYHPLFEQSLALYRGEPLGQVVGRVLLEAFAKALLKMMPNASPLTCLETPRLPDEDAAFEAQVLERWLDDGGIPNAASDREDLSDAEVLNQLH